MVRRRVSVGEVQAALADSEVFEVIADRQRYGLLAVVGGRPLHLWVADDEIIGETVLVSVYEPDEVHGWSAASGWRRRIEQEEGL